MSMRSVFKRLRLSSSDRRTLSLVHEFTATSSPIPSGSSCAATPSGMGSSTRPIFVDMTKESRSTEVYEENPILASARPVP